MATKRHKKHKRKERRRITATKKYKKRKNKNGHKKAQSFLRSPISTGQKAQKERKKKSNDHKEIQKKKD